MKRNLNKINFRKVMFAAWGESKSEAETKNPVEEETTNLCLMASHDNKTVKSKGKETMSSCSFPNHLFSLEKYKLIELLMETQEQLEEISVKCFQIEKDLKISKDHVSYLNSSRSDV